MSLGGNREGLQAGGGPSVSPLAQLADGGRCVWTRYSSASMKQGGSGHLQPMSLPLVPPPKFGLAKGLFPGDLHAAAKRLVPVGGLLQAMYPAESKTCKREEVTGAHLEMLHTISLPAGPLHTRSKMPFPDALDCVLKLSVSSKVPVHFVDTEKLLSFSRSSWEVYTHTHWFRQVFEPLCLLTKSLQRNQNVFGLCSPLERTEQGFCFPSAVDYGDSRRPGCARETTQCWMHTADSSCGSCPSWRATHNPCAGQG